MLFISQIAKIVIFNNNLPLVTRFQNVLTSPSDYGYMSPAAYMPTQNNIPVVFRQKQTTLLLFLYHAWESIYTLLVPII